MRASRCLTCFGSKASRCPTRRHIYIFYICVRTSHLYIYIHTYICTYVAFSRSQSLRLSLSLFFSLFLSFGAGISSESPCHMFSSSERPLHFEEQLVASAFPGSRRSLSPGSWVPGWGLCLFALWFTNWMAVLFCCFSCYFGAGSGIEGRHSGFPRVTCFSWPRVLVLGRSIWRSGRRRGPAVFKFGLSLVFGGLSVGFLRLISLYLFGFLCLERGTGTRDRKEGEDSFIRGTRKEGNTEIHQIKNRPTSSVAHMGPKIVSSRTCKLFTWRWRHLNTHWGQPHIEPAVKNVNLN